MRTWLAPLALASLAFAQPAAAQDASDETAAMAEILGGLFEAEPLTAEQQARLPLAEQVVGVMMPDGFYAELMRDMMQDTMAPMLGLASSPEVILTARLDVSEEAIAQLGEAERRELLNIIDPAYARRAEAMTDALMGSMEGMFAAMEPPMREGLSRAYAVRFDAAQLADIAAFFATPTGELYATQSMALFSDPQVMSATMNAVPEMLGNYVQIEQAMADALAELPAERAASDLSESERARVARILGVRPAEVDDVIRPPQEM